jgi:hypothetical protein
MTVVLAPPLQGLWDDVRSRKQAIADCAGNCAATQLGTVGGAVMMIQ